MAILHLWQDIVECRTGNVKAISMEGMESSNHTSNNSGVRVVDLDEEDSQNNQEKVDNPVLNSDSVSIDSISRKSNNNLTGKDENKGDFNTNISASDFLNEKLSGSQNQKQNNANQGSEVLTELENGTMNETI